MDRRNVALRTGFSLGLLRGQVCDKFTGIDTERVGEHENVDQADVALPTLHRPNIGPVQT